MPDDLSVYVHVPWCTTRCPYCDFNTYMFSAGRSEFARLAAREIASYAGDGRRVKTVFVGGGTPTLLPPEDLGAIVRAIDEHLGLEPDAEVTVEANPESVTPHALAALREQGFTRVSLGMQSAVPHVLAFLGRTHAPERPPAAAREARAAGFEHVSLDLIYGSPVETDDDWRRSVDEALAAEPDHMSAYALTVEPGTRLAADVAHGRVSPPDDGALADRYAIADDAFRAAGLDWYEVSSWATDDAARCHHNEGYWHGADWLPIGPGAHGHLRGRRWWTVRHPAAWAARVEAGTSTEAGGEDLDERQRHLERLMLEVRTREGLDRAVAPEAAAAALVEEGLLARAGERLVLTLEGRLLADLVTRRLAA